ncbi:MAG: glycosyltransferase family 2 protein, partial [Chloroflexota bacterium]
IRSELLRRVSFDIGFEGNGWREESDFQVGALEAGYRLVHCPHTLGFHTPGGVGRASGGSRGRSRLNYELWVMRNNARFLRKHWGYLRSGRSELRVPPLPELAVALQAALRGVRAARKLFRQLVVGRGPVPRRPGAGETPALPGAAGDSPALPAEGRR